MPGFFPWWVVITHFLNIFFLLLMALSGLEVLSAFPKLYWHDDCPPGRKWLRLSKKMYAADSRKPWSSQDEEVAWSPVLALPGSKNLGLGRHQAIELVEDTSTIGMGVGGWREDQQFYANAAGI